MGKEKKVSKKIGKKKKKEEKKWKWVESQKHIIWSSEIQLKLLKEEKRLDSFSLRS